MKTRVQYLRNSNGSPIGCVVVAVDRHNKQISYQISTCNPVDPFDSKEARLLALTRLVEAPMRLPLPRNNANMNTITEAIMKSLSSSKKVPSRVCKAANRWLQTEHTSSDSQ